ncbi:hypothetical protein [Sphingopyxis solisilvae]|uniref:hypothetical protein n=1 Tax=Sphingopyxis solisilvae TaxID=1886788 RepID=UPI00189298D4|nr:hypothetical protein [Sphingopyxis solisilvae]
MRSPMLSIVWFTIGFALLAALYTGLMFQFWAIGFVLLLTGASYAALGGYAIGSLRSTDNVNERPTSALFNIIVAVIALLGLWAMFYDRTTNRGIDYVNLGIAAARAEFTRVGERGGLLSIAGNIFSAAVYLPMINMIFDWEKWGRERYLVAALVVVGMLGLTYITGGRTALLIGVSLVAAAILGRGAIGLPRLPSFLSRLRLIIGGIVVAVVFGGIFALRATAFGAASAGDYLSQLCIHLAQPAIEIMAQCYSIPYSSGVEGVDELANFGTAVLLYAFHVAWVGNVIIVDANPGVSTAFSGFQEMFLGRFGYQLTATDYDGYFIPAAASVVYDFGYLAMIIGFALLGFMLGLFRRSMLAGNLYLGRVAFCYVAAALLICVLISPANLPVLLLSIMAITAIAGTTTFARSAGIELVFLNKVLARETKR